MEHRYSKRLTAGLKLTIYKRGVPVTTGCVKDLSGSGLFVETDSSGFNLHQTLEVEFQPDFQQSNTEPARPCRFKTLVVRKAAKGLGLEFEDMNRASQDALRVLMESLYAPENRQLPQRLARC